MKLNMFKADQAGFWFLTGQCRWCGYRFRSYWPTCDRATPRYVGYQYNSPGDVSQSYDTGCEWWLFWWYRLSQPPSWQWSARSSQSRVPNPDPRPGKPRDCIPCNIVWGNLARRVKASLYGPHLRRMIELAFNTLQKWPNCKLVILNGAGTILLYNHCPLKFAYPTSVFTMIDSMKQS